MAKRDSGQSIGEDLLERLEADIDMPVLPASFEHLMEMTRRPLDELDPQMVVKGIEREPALAARVMRMANSPRYGFVRKVSTLSRAVGLLGLRETLNTVNFFAFARFVERQEQLPSSKGREFWRHSLACAVAARQMAEQSGRGSPGLFYLLGLFHDVGKLVLMVYAGELFERCVSFAHQENKPLQVMERELLGLDHARIGARLLRLWNLPEIFEAVTEAHHAPHIASPELQWTAGCIEMADMIANLSGIAHTGNPNNIQIDYAWLRQTHHQDAPHYLDDPQNLDRLIQSIWNQCDLLGCLVSAEHEATGARASSVQFGETTSFHGCKASRPKHPDVGKHSANRLGTLVARWFRSIWQNRAD
mgnify:CR=1 FL=1